MFDFLPSYILVACENYIRNNVNVIPNYLQLLLQLMYGLDTCDHAACVHFHGPLNMKLSTCL